MSRFRFYMSHTSRGIRVRAQFVARGILQCTGKKKGCYFGLQRVYNSALSLAYIVIFRSTQVKNVKNCFWPKRKAPCFNEESIRSILLLFATAHREQDLYYYRRVISIAIGTMRMDRSSDSWR